ncbi:hypothetical protein Lal_00017065 [Lupinus albus]|nr:hypothetical protein Lal_00017065 [Lupinus albus]
MEANKQYPKDRTLGYAQYVSNFVYVKSNMCWKPRKSGYAIGRLIWVSPCTSELYYLRMMLAVIMGPIYCEDIRTVSNIQYSSFKDACFAIGLLKDDRECIEALIEARGCGLLIENLLEGNRRSVKDYPSMSYPNGQESRLSERIVAWARETHLGGKGFSLEREWSRLSESGLTGARVVSPGREKWHSGPVEAVRSSLERELPRLSEKSLA